MDNTDQNFISALRENARTSLSGSAHRLGVSRTTVRSRIERLQQRGDVLGFTVFLKDDPVRGVMLIGIEGRCTDRIVRQLTGLPELRAVHSTNGRWDVIAEIGTKSLEDFDHTLAKIRRIEGITSSETSLLLATRKAR